MGKKKQEQKVVLSPDLPPEVHEDEVEVSDEDLQFVNENQEYAGFISTFDTRSIMSLKGVDSIGKCTKWR